MDHKNVEGDATPEQTVAEPVCEADRLLGRYGQALDGEGMSAEQKGQCLLALFQVMRAFVDLGFSIRAGDKFAQNAAFGMDDVLQYLISNDTAHETVAPEKNPTNEEQ